MIFWPLLRHHSTEPIVMNIPAIERSFAREQCSSYLRNTIYLRTDSVFPHTECKKALGARNKYQSTA